MYLSLIGSTYISIRIYQPYLVSSENAPQEVFIDVFKSYEKINVNPGGIFNELVLYVVQNYGMRP